MQKSQSDPLVATAAMAPAAPVPPYSSTASTTEPAKPQSTLAAPSTTTPDSYFYSRLKAQVEFYFSSQNLARDTYLRGLMAHYGGSMVPLGIIASFPKVREIAAIKTGTNSVPADPILMMKAMEGSTVAKITPDGYWISAQAPLPPLDPTASVKLRQISQQQQQLQPPLLSLQGGHMLSGHIQPQPLLRRQISSGSNIIATTPNRDPSPLSHASSNPELTRSLSRSTLIVSDIPTDIATEVVMSAFTTDTIIPTSAKPNDTKAWAVTFASEKDAQIALSAAADRTINGLPIRAKIINEKLSPTTTALNQEGFSETDSNKQPQQLQQQLQYSSSQNRHTSLPHMPIQQQQQQQHPQYMAPPQGMPKNGPAVSYPYPYSYQPSFQYAGGGGRYPPYMQPPSAGPHGAAALQYPPHMYSHGYQYMPSAGAAGRPYYSGPSPPVFMRSVTDPGGQMRPNPMVKTKSDISNKSQQLKKNNNNNNSKFKRGQQGVYNNGGGLNQFQRVNKGSREGLDTFKGSNKNKDSSSQGGLSRRKPTSSPILHASDSYDAKAANKNNKKSNKKSKRREGESSDIDRPKDQNKSETEIFDENMFPALSPSKTKAASDNDATAAVAASTNNNGFNYAAALRQTNKPKPAAPEPSNLKGELNSTTIEGMVDKMKISDNHNKSSDSNNSERPSIEAAKSAYAVPDQSTKHHSDNTKNEKLSNGLASTLSDSKSVLTNSVKVPHVSKDNNVENSISETENKLISKKELTNSIPNNENVPSKKNNEAETENAAPSGAWGSKRSFIDVVKRQS